MKILWYLFCFFSLPIQSLPYDSISDLYDTDYQYEEMDNDISEEVRVTKTPEFISKPLKIIENEGSTLRLPCFVDNLEGFVLLWRKGGLIIAVGDQVIDSFEERIHLDKKSGGNYLVIKQANPTDEAEYVCSVSAFKKTDIRHDVRIRVKPVIVTNPKGTLAIKEGDSAELSCHVVSGSPSPKLRWRKLLGPLPTGQLAKEGGLIKFESVRRHYTGNYVCEADNGFDDSPVTSLVRIEVEYGPSVNLTKSEDSRTEMTITCMVDSNPPSQISWLKDGVKLDTENLSLVVSEHKNKQILSLVDLNEETFGNYSCIAENKLGKDQKNAKIAGWPKEANLKLYFLPKFGQDPLINISLESETVVTHFKVVLKSADNQHWQEVLVSATHSEDQDSVWVGRTRLKSLVGGTEYSASVASANNFGFGPFGEMFNFTTVNLDTTDKSVGSSSCILVPALLVIAVTAVSITVIL